MAGAPMPALLKRRSRRPKVSLVRAKRFRMEPGSATSVGTTSARLFAAPAAAATRASVSSPRPPRGRARGGAGRGPSPMPLPAPVTIATLFWVAMGSISFVSALADLVALDRGRVEREPEARLARHHQLAPLERGRLLEELERPRHVLHREPVGNGGDEVHVELGDEVAHHRQVEGLRHAGDL